MLNKKGQGVTLTEVLVVMLIIAILAALALPQFAATRERALSKEAKANLKLIDAAEKIYRMENAIYYPYAAGQVDDPATINDKLKLSISETNWNYSLVGDGSGGTYSAYANRSGTGGYYDCEYSLNSSGGDPTGNSNCP